MASTLEKDFYDWLYELLDANKIALENTDVIFKSEGKHPKDQYPCIYLIWDDLLGEEHSKGADTEIRSDFGFRIRVYIKHQDQNGETKLLLILSKIRNLIRSNRGEMPSGCFPESIRFAAGARLPKTAEYGYGKEMSGRIELFYSMLTGTTT